MLPKTCVLLLGAWEPGEVCNKTEQGLEPGWPWAHWLQQLQSACFVVVAYWPAACGFFLGQGSNLCPLHWQVDSQPPRKF